MISAIISDGKPRRLFRLGLNEKYKILISEEITDELSGVLGRKKFKMRKEEIDNIVTVLRNTAEIIPIESDFKVGIWMITQYCARLLTEMPIIWYRGITT